ncbi:YncE family protein [Flavobacterium rhizosphaerae]|uniref:YncE family protein n=1 Tax=Flavobacterium rhizosphaerae TaxID=3163298 RepID=A0ABW8YX70_9FLAO
MNFNKLFLVTLLGVFMASCSNDDNGLETPSGAYADGVIVLNQGGFLAGNSSVSFISDAFELENNIYSAVNGGALLGDTGQDIGFNDDLAYIVMNASNKIEVVDRYTFDHVATISAGLENPRYIAFDDNKAFVTNWGDASIATDDYVAVIDLDANTIVTTIPVAEGPERIVENNGKLYVSHYGGYGFGNSVSVINTNANTVSNTISVGDRPNFMEVKDNKLYVLSEGLPNYASAETTGKLQVINLSNNTVVSTLNFAGIQHPTNMVLEDGKIYYTIGADVFTMQKDAATLPAEPAFSTTAQEVSGIYAFNVSEDHIYVADAVDYSQEGKVYVYSATGALQHNYTVGVIPCGFYFN